MSTWIDYLGYKFVLSPGKKFQASILSLLEAGNLRTVLKKRNKHKLANVNCLWKFSTVSYRIKKILIEKLTPASLL